MLTLCEIGYIQERVVNICRLERLVSRFAPKAKRLLALLPSWSDNRPVVHNLQNSQKQL